jgi:hypothetical protein
MKPQRAFRPTADHLEPRDVPSSLGLPQFATPAIASHVFNRFTNSLRPMVVSNFSRQSSVTRTALNQVAGGANTNLGLNQFGVNSLLNRSGSNSSNGLVTTLNNANLGLAGTAAGTGLASNTSTGLAGNLGSLLQNIGLNSSQLVNNQLGLPTSLRNLLSIRTAGATNFNNGLGLTSMF